MFEKRVSINRPSRPISFRRLVDGSIADIGIEQFPVENKNENGFPKNDVTLLLEVSRKSGVDNSLFEKIASRLNVITPKSSRSKNLEDLWKEWKPASLQTPSELAAFEEYWVSKYAEPSVAEPAKVVETTPTDEPPQVSSDSK